MAFVHFLVYQFKKRPLIRMVVIFGALFILVSFFSILINFKYKKPLLLSINPQIGQGGDVMTLQGRYFGTRDVYSKIEIGGINITNSAYISWTDTTIKILLPKSIENGPVYVFTKYGISEPSIFANKETIPVPIVHNPEITIPQITEISSSKNTIGSVLKIKGKNFGVLRGDSQVFFTANVSPKPNEVSLIPCSEFDKDYQFWSSAEIHVRIPDGAGNGNVYIKTNKGMSDGEPYRLNNEVTAKKYDKIRSYVIKTNVDIQDAVADRQTTLSLFIPRPVATATQPSPKVIESDPPASLDNYMNTLVHQFSLVNASDKKQNFSHTFVISVYEVHTNIAEKTVKPFSEFAKKIYRTYLNADFLIPSSDPEIIALSADIVKKTQNPLQKAQLLYNYLVDTIEPVESQTEIEVTALDTLTTQQADAYQFATLYTALLRAAAIPSIVCGGILADADMTNKPHWWCEFYLEDYGWIPADPALGADFAHGNPTPENNNTDFYFGNMDSSHVCFSRGINNIKPAHINGTKVYRPHSYALQTVWEEASSGKITYSSYWTEPSIVGIY